MGVTPNGLPYPEDSDPVAEGAQAIEALARALRIAAGNAYVNPGPSSQSVAVTFPAGLFTGVNAPVLAVTAASTFISAGAATATVNGVTLSAVYRTGQGVVANIPSRSLIRWVAIGVGTP